jgi:hypothetical protein
MTRRLHAPAIILACMLAGAFAVQAIADVGTAIAADAPVELDAGPSAKPLETPAPIPPVVAIADPVADPSGYAKDVTSAFRAGQWAFLVVLVLFALARALLWAAAKWSIAWLKKATPSLVAVSVALASIGASLSAGAGVDVRAVLGALAMAVALYLSPSPVPKSATPA